MFNYIPFYLRKWGILEKFNFSKQVTFGNAKVKIPFIKGIGTANYYMSETWMVKLINLLIDEDTGCFIDVGANIGQTLIKLKAAKNNIIYYGFEPNPSCVFYLNELVRINNYENSFIYPIGISKKTDLFTLRTFNTNITDSAASLVSDYRENDKVYHQIIVPVFDGKPVEELTNSLRVHIIKIDVEGGEQDVLEGLENVISKWNPFIFIEILPTNVSTNFAVKVASLQKLIKSLNYEIYRIDKINNDFKGLTLIEQINNTSDYLLADYLLAPVSKAAICKNLFFNN